MVSSPSPRFKAPDTTLIIFAIIVLASILTWIVPAGSFQKTTMEVEGIGTREVVVPGSYEQLEPDAGSTVLGRLRHSVGIVFMAPVLGFADEDVAPIIAFVLFIGGAFAVLLKTGAIDAALRRMVRVARKSAVMERLLIPLFMIVFSLGGAVFGMAEETIPFILVFVPLALALGYDSITGAAIPLLGSGAGFAAAFLNPFTVGVAQGIAEVPLFSGFGFRFVLWIGTTSLSIAFVMWHAHRVRLDPSKSPTAELDQRKRETGMHLDETDDTFTRSQRNVLLIFGLAIGILIYGVLEQGWYIIEIAALFIATGMLMGIVGGLGANQTALSFMDGARDLVATALVIGVARGILVVMQDGQIIDTILNNLANGLDGTGPTVAAQGMFGLQTLINFFVPSGSGQAALTMPLMAPLSDLLGVTRQIAVLAYQMGDGFTNMIIPTNPVLLGALSLAHVPWTKWAKWIVPLQILLFVLGLFALFMAVQIGYSA